MGLTAECMHIIQIFSRYEYNIIHCSRTGNNVCKNPLFLNVLKIKNNLKLNICLLGRGLNNLKVNRNGTQIKESL